MGNNQTGVMFVVVAMICIMGGFVVFMLNMQKEPPAKRAIECRNEWSVISFLIDEDNETVMMAGEFLDPSSIKTFNETAISAQWTHDSGNGETKVFLDRIAGHLEVETKEKGLDWEKNEFECRNTRVKF